MKKQDYVTLARTIRADVEKWSPADGLGLGEAHERYCARRALSLQAAELARYLADHLHVDREAFLIACGIKP